MTNQEILSHIDLTCLTVTAPREKYYRLIQTAHKYGCASVCIPPSRVAEIRDAMERSTFKSPITTVIGFPNGYSTKESKLKEIECAIASGASELDMVINNNDAADENWPAIKSEIEEAALLAHKNNAIIKIIVESSLHDDDTIRILTRLCGEAGADYIKTSTGFSQSGGASKEKVLVMKEVIDKEHLNLKIKAAGGIRTKEDMEWYLTNGCDRIGASSVDALIGI